MEGRKERCKKRKEEGRAFFFVSWHCSECLLDELINERAAAGRTLPLQSWSLINEGTPFLTCSRNNHILGKVHCILLKPTECLTHSWHKIHTWMIKCLLDWDSHYTVNYQVRWFSALRLLLDQSPPPLVCLGVPFRKVQSFWGNSPIIMTASLSWH